MRAALLAIKDFFVFVWYMVTSYGKVAWWVYPTKTQDIMGIELCERHKAVQFASWAVLQLPFIRQLKSYHHGLILEVFYALGPYAYINVYPVILDLAPDTDLAYPRIRYNPNGPELGLTQPFLIHVDRSYDPFCLKFVDANESFYYNCDEPLKTYRIDLSRVDLPVHEPFGSVPDIERSPNGYWTNRTHDKATV